MARDQRWPLRLILPTLFALLVFSIITVGVAATLIDPRTINKDFFEYGYIYVMPPLAGAGFTAVSIIIHLICFITNSLHPLVVLTLAIEFMIGWLVIIGVTGSQYTYASGCSLDMSRNAYNSAQDRDSGSYWGGYYYGSSSGDVTDDDWDTIMGNEESICHRSTTLLVFSVLVTIAYIALIIIAAKIRRKTRVPYTRPTDAEKAAPLMSSVEPGTGEKATAEATAGRAVPLSADQPEPGTARFA